VPVEGDAIGICQESGVVIKTLETFMVGDDGTFALAKSAGLTYGIIDGFVAKQHRISLPETT
jgi:hypothetical protein